MRCLPAPQLSTGSAVPCCRLGTRLPHTLLRKLLNIILIYLKVDYRLNYITTLSTRPRLVCSSRKRKVVTLTSSRRPALFPSFVFFFDLLDEMLQLGDFSLQLLDVLSVLGTIFVRVLVLCLCCALAAPGAWLRADAVPAFLLPVQVVFSTLRR